MKMHYAKEWNEILRYQRDKRGWSQQRLANELGTTEKVVGRWERGESKPGPFYREKLIEQQELPDPAHESTPPLVEQERSSAYSLHGALARSITSQVGNPAVGASGIQQGVPTVLIRAYQAIDRLYETAESTPEEQSGIRLASCAGDLVYFLEEGWPVAEVFDALHIILKVVQAMPKSIRQFSRRTFFERLLELGVAAVIGGISLPTSTHVSFEERARLHDAFGESIAAAWKLFHTAGNAQVLAIGQAQLYLIQQAHPVLAPRERNMFYSSAYNLIGKSLHFQERYQEALDAHINAHVAAMGTGNPWQVAQSLICQADSRQALGQHAEAIDTIEEALCMLGNPTEETLLRSKAHLLGCWADNAMAIGEHTMAEEKLEAAAAFLDQISPSEEFDRTYWLQLVGKYALKTGDYIAAIRSYEQALTELPPSWIIRQTFILIPLMVAYACKRDREMSLATADKAVVAVSALNAPAMNKQLLASVRCGLLDAFPNDVAVQKFATDLCRRLPVLTAKAGSRR
jgi:tetratricopeptide (TPR) repeat protein